MYIYETQFHNLPLDLMIRTIITPKKQKVSIVVPQSYVGKEIEVIAFAKDEGVGKEIIKQKEVSFTAVVLDTTDYKFNRDDANDR